MAIKLQTSSINKNFPERGSAVTARWLYYRQTLTLLLFMGCHYFCPNEMANPDFFLHFE